MADQLVAITSKCFALNGRQRTQRLAELRQAPDPQLRENGVPPPAQENSGGVPFRSAVDVRAPKTTRSSCHHATRTASASFRDLPKVQSVTHPAKPPVGCVSRG